MQEQQSECINEISNPKFEAERLTGLFYSLQPTDEKNITLARDSSFIAVNEILSVLGGFQQHEYAKVLIPFYEKVKNEI